MACYRSGGCGPYEMLSCSDCPASKKSYIKKSKFAVGECVRIVKTEAFPYIQETWIGEVLEILSIMNDEKAGFIYKCKFESEKQGEIFVKEDALEFAF